ncbi:MAG: hypothetical protein ACRCXB_13095 [Aeromonadaceae bacterium]
MYSQYDLKYSDDDSDDVYDFIESLKISRDAFWVFRKELPDDFDGDFEYTCHSNESAKAMVSIKSLGVSNLSAGGHCPASNEIWAIEISNGFMVSDKIQVSV